MRCYNYFLVFIIYVISISFTTSNVTAASNVEQEPNNDMLTANLIEVNNTYYGHSTHTGSYDYDYFKFTLEEAGQISLKMKNHKDYSWSFMIKNGQNALLLDATSEKGIKVIDQNSTHTTRAVGLPAGTYYIQLYGESSGMGELQYEMEVSFQNGQFFEKELNNSMSTASPVELNNTYYGHSTYRNGSYDYDYYKFTLEKAGQVVLTMKNDKDYTWRYEIRNAENLQLLDTTTEKGVLVIDQNRKQTVRSVGLPAGTYYIQVYGQDSLMDHVQYELNVGFIEGEVFEKEPNNNKEMATSLQLNNTYYGHSTMRNGYADNDYYKVTLEKAGQLTLSMKNNKDYSWRFMLESADNIRLLDSDTEKGIQVIDQNKLSTAYSVGLSPGTYYIQVYGQANGMDHLQYELDVRFQAGELFEKEPNNKLETATQLHLNNTYYGHSTINNGTVDIDYYKFTLEKSEKVTLSLKDHDRFTWGYQLTDLNGKNIVNGATVIDSVQQGTYTMKTVDLLAGTYYVRISAHHGYMNHVPYLVAVNAHSSGYHEWQPEKRNVDPKHPWTITFNDFLDKATVNNANVYVLHNNTYVSDIKVSLNSNTKSIRIESPPKGYIAGETYTLYIEKHIKSAKGIELTKTIKMNFTIKK